MPKVQPWMAQVGGDSIVVGGGFFCGVVVGARTGGYNGHIEGAACLPFERHIASNLKYKYE